MTNPTNSALHMMEGQGGWQWVPKEPTDAMTWAGQQARYPSAHSITVIYKAMLEAAPKTAASAGVPLPCPFCGHVGLDFAEGSTFRWIIASCSGCGATKGETRIQTLGEGTKAGWMAEAQRDAIADWNARAAPKTALSHFADEVEASGEAEKHAAPVPAFQLYWSDARARYSVSKPCIGDTDVYTADQVRLLVEQVVNSRALYEKSQELFARERGITKELAAALVLMRAAFLSHTQWNGDLPSEIRVADAALSKVQQP